MKVAFLDIESTNLAADNGIGFVLCACVKVLGRKHIHTFRIDDSPGYRKCLYNDAHLVDRLAKFLHEANPDLLVHFNGDWFDIPYINSRLLGSDIRGLDAFRSMDHWKTSRYRLKLRNHSLATMAEHLRVKHHKTYYEPRIWQRAMFGSRVDLDKIVDHCEKDVLVLEECHQKVVPLLRSVRGII